MSPIGTRTTRPVALEAGLAVLTVCVGALVLSAARSTAAPASPPRPTSSRSSPAAPSRAVGSASRGSWTGSAPLSFAFRWVRCGADGGEPTAATARSCGVRRARGTTSRARTSASGCASASPRRTPRLPDRRLEPDRGRGRGPVNTSIPIVSGTVVARRLTVQPGSWSGRQPITFAYAWLRCNTAGGECARRSPAQPVAATGSRPPTSTTSSAST